MIFKKYVNVAVAADTPIFLADWIFTGIEAALEHVAKDVTVGGIIFFQKF
jgi:hypothetical protein